MSQFFLIALGTLASEDLACIAAGVLIAQGRLGFMEGTLACLAGIFVGDTLVFLCGRLLGRAGLNRWPLSRMLSKERVDRASEWLSRRGRTVVLISRFTPGLRLSTYFAAGLLRTRFWPFAGYFLLAAALWPPLLVGGTALLGEGARADGSGAVAFAPFSAAAFGLYKLFPRAVRFVKRKRWEFWPPWAVYLPLAPYFLYLAIRHRSFTVFTAVNPGIPSSGLVGESKSHILAHLSTVPGAVAEFEVIHAGQRDYQPHEYPLVLKPDQGERGAGVAIIRTPAEAGAYLQQATGDIIAQRYVPGVEFGIFWARYPHQQRGRVLSITRKMFPKVTGDGVLSVGELVALDARASSIADVYHASCKRPMEDVPAAGETVPLVEIGSHCRGAIFLDGWRLHTPALEEAIGRISNAHPGFYFGRYDVRADSVEALQAGQFKVIELNGVSGEPTHIYDPAVSLVSAYAALVHHWRMAFEIGAMNRDRGARPMTVRELLRLVLHFRRGVGPSGRRSAHLQELTAARHR